MMAPLVTRRRFLTWAAASPWACALAGSTSRRIRIGQIGTSHSHAAGKIEAIRSLPQLYELAGVVESSATQRALIRSQQAYVGVNWTTEEALLADPSVRAMTVETSLEDSSRAALTCLRAGKHVHLDKPGTASHEAFRTLRLEAERRGLTVQMGYMLRYNPAIQLLMQAHREGWLGDITEIDASLGKLADASAQNPLVQHPGHGMFELACHMVDLIVSLLGAPSRVQAFGLTTGLSLSSLKDNQVAVLEYPKAVVVLRCNHGDPFGWPHRRIQVVGTRGAMEIRPLESGQGTLYLSEARGGFVSGENRLALTVPPGRYTGEFRDLAQVIQDGKTFAWSAQHDITAHATALRCAGLQP